MAAGGEAGTDVMVDEVLGTVEGVVAGEESARGGAVPAGEDVAAWVAGGSGDRGATGVRAATCAGVADGAADIADATGAPISTGARVAAGEIGATAAGLATVDGAAAGTGIAAGNGPATGGASTRSSTPRGAAASAVFLQRLLKYRASSSFRGLKAIRMPPSLMPCS